MTNCASSVSIVKGIIEATRQKFSSEPASESSSPAVSLPLYTGSCGSSAVCDNIYTVSCVSGSNCAGSAVGLLGFASTRFA